ncbi:MAG: hypothetical protein JWQ66_2933 [Mucilaginibacter sp.]|nr:hypothetical protein [Mucilaginibacter sp.]
MKKLITITALALLALSCKKENTACEVGDSCLVKSDVFNKGAYQPVLPVHADSTYIDGASHLRYLTVTDKQNVKWYLPQEDLRRILK